MKHLFLSLFVLFSWQQLASAASQPFSFEEGSISTAMQEDILAVVAAATDLSSHLDALKYKYEAWQSKDEGDVYYESFETEFVGGESNLDPDDEVFEEKNKDRFKFEFIKRAIANLNYLHIATGEGHTEVVTMLIDQGVNIHATDKWGMTATVETIESADDVDSFIRKALRISLRAKNGANRFISIGELSLITRNIEKSADDLTHAALALQDRLWWELAGWTTF